MLRPVPAQANNPNQEELGIRQDRVLPSGERLIAVTDTSSFLSYWQKTSVGSVSITGSSQRVQYCRQGAGSHALQGRTLACSIQMLQSNAVLEPSCSLAGRRGDTVAGSAVSVIATFGQSGR